MAVYNIGNGTAMRHINRHRGFGLIISLALGGLSACAPAEAPQSVQLSGLAVTPEILQTMAYPVKGYTVLIQQIEQPIDHADPDKGTFQQQVIVLKPVGVAADAPVHFMLGNETDWTPARLEALYSSYGSPKDMIFITADHRGYGQSIADIDQSVPSYVTLDGAMADYDRLVKLYKTIYPGEWTGGGCSFGGSLAINFAHAYPQNFTALLASSAPTKWEFVTLEYSPQAEKNLGPTLAGNIATHMRVLKPKAAYDEIWIDRERLFALTVALSQMEEMRPIKPMIEKLSKLPTADFLTAIKTQFPAELRQRIDDWAVRRVPSATLSAEEVKSGKYNWHTWKYQQCTEAGTYFMGDLFPYSREELVADCKASFGEAPAYLSADPWPVDQMLGELKMPVMVVSGGQDPWMQVGVGPNHRYNNITYRYFPDALHCPDVYLPDVGKSVFADFRGL